MDKNIFRGKQIKTNIQNFFYLNLIFGINYLRVN